MRYKTVPAAGMKAASNEVRVVNRLAARMRIVPKGPAMIPMAEQAGLGPLLRSPDTAQRRQSTRSRLAAD